MSLKLNSTEEVTISIISTKICRGKGATKTPLRGWNLFQSIEKGNRPRACIYATPDLCCSLIPMFSNKDIVAVRVNNVCQSGDSFVFVSAYMAAEEPAPPNLSRDLLVFAEYEHIPTIVGTDANAHHTIWGSSKINQGCGSGSWKRKRWKRLIFCGSGSTLIKEVGSGSEIGSESVEKEPEEEAILSKSGASGFSTWLQPLG